MLENHSVTDCYHCGEPVPGNHIYYVTINGREEPMCCPGCKAVAETIVSYGLENFYRFRTGHSGKPEEIVPEDLLRFRIYDDKQFQSAFTESQHEGQHSVNLVLQDIVCPACTWLIETRLAGMPGVAEVKVNYASNRAEVTWNDIDTSLSEILNTIHSLGYKAYPYDPARKTNLMEIERKSHLRRLGLAGLLGMQVMMLSIAIYAGDWTGIEEQHRNFFYWICLLLTTPVVIYSARPFFLRAWRDVMEFRTGMDVPVSLGITIAYVASIRATITGEGYVYYDSVVMFVFLLLTARYFEFMARKRATQHYDEIGKIIPAIATRMDFRDGEEQAMPVPAASLQVGDRILIRPGETISADGTIITGASVIDESLITGESIPVKRAVGDRVIGGSINIDSPIEVGIENIGKDTMLANLIRLADAGRSDKPAVTQMANRVASWFVFAVLIITAAVAGYWWHVNHEHWLPVTISMLVITCPCALSLATPVAVTAAGSRLMSRGLVIINNEALETLARASHYIFDKTGTLTEGRYRLVEINTETGQDKETCLAIAASLERNSEHPLARAILEYDEDIRFLHAEQVINRPGMGISGLVDNRECFLGTESFVREHTGLGPVNIPGKSTLLTTIILADHSGVLGIFEFRDKVREGAEKLITDLKLGNRVVQIFSGDSVDVVRSVAEALGIDQYYGRMTPEEKMTKVRELMEQGGIVAFTGDGINDAPVLSTAHVSVAMGAGVDITRLHADMVLLNNNLNVLNEAVFHAARTTRVIRQNFCWAIGYNLLAIPAAAAGLVAPWLAAIGMSLSSLIVVGNSMRLS